MKNLKRCRDDIVNILSNYNIEYMSWSKLSKDINFIECFNEVYPSLKDESIRVKAYFIFDNYNFEDILCPCCKTKIKRFNTNKNKFFIYCSDECSKKNKGQNISKGLHKAYGENKENIVEKRKQTNIEKYGSSCQFIGKKEQIKQTNIKKYGFDNFFKTDMTKYWTKSGMYYNQSHFTNINDMTKEYLVDNFLNGDKFNMIEASNYFNCSYDKLRKLLKDFDIEYKNHSQSYAELYIIDYLKSLNIKVEIKHRLFGKEIDILCNDYKFGIEYNDLIFHSFGKDSSSILNNIDSLNTKKHLDKTNMMEEHGYTLFHIFENEFENIDKRNIWFSMIRNKIGLSDKIYARKCIIKEISSNESKEFLKFNHIQGNINSSINLGLFYNDELVSLMTLGKPRIDKKHDYEIYRYCNKIGTHVIGAASKLLKYFERNYKPLSIISYANRRWSRGNLYQKLGFKLENISKPNFFYFKQSESSKTLISRLKFQKFKLESNLENYDQNLTALQNMVNNGYRVIYDSGNLVYSKQI